MCRSFVHNLSVGSSPPAARGRPASRGSSRRGATGRPRTRGRSVKAPRRDHYEHVHRAVGSRFFCALRCRSGEEGRGMATSIWFWVAFNGFVLAMLALDLGVFHRKAHEVRLREAAMWSGIWVSVALLFNAAIWAFAGRQPALEFLTGYLVEKSLAVDNIFVIALIFSYFAVPEKYQHRVLFWGILGALVMRGAFIGAGAYALERWHWVIYLFGGILLLTGIKLAVRKDEGFDPAHNPVLRFVRRLMPVSTEYDGQ